MPVFAALSSIERRLVHLIEVIRISSWGFAGIGTELYPRAWLGARPVQRLKARVNAAASE